MLWYILQIRRRKGRVSIFEMRPFRLYTFLRLAYFWGV
jgi:hypothetical protein